MLKCNLIVLLCIWHISFGAAPQRQLAGVEARRNRRAVPPLIFPRTAPTRIQWIIGVGIPLEDLVFEAMTTGYVIKAEYFLPYEASQLRTKTTLNIAGRSDDGSDGGGGGTGESGGNATNTTNNQTSNDWRQHLRNTMWASGKALSSYRWALYKGLEHLAIKLGLNGRPCVLKSICESAELHLHVANGLFGELLHILLTPSSSVDELSEHADNEYFQAEYLGRASRDAGNCQRVYKDCPTSLLERFSDVYTLGDNFSHFNGLQDLLDAIS